MAELKKKVTLKRKVEMTDEATAPSKSSNKVWLIAVGLVVLFSVGYFYLNTSTTDDITGDKAGTAPMKTEVPVETKEDSTISVGEPVAVKTDDVAIGSVPDGKEIPINNNQPYKKGEIYNVYQFPFGIADYSQPNAELDKLVDAMKKNSDLKISVTAYTDNIGNPNYNLGLSEKRAKAIFGYLVSKGIVANKITYKGNGISSKYPNPSDNRRAEFVLL